MAAALLGCVLAACQWPRDAEGTLDRVRGGTLRVGVTEAAPWVVLDAERQPAGVEVRLVEALADDLAADVVWVEGSESELMEALHVRALDLVVGGLDSSARGRSRRRSRAPTRSPARSSPYPRRRPYPHPSPAGRSPSRSGPRRSSGSACRT